MVETDHLGIDPDDELAQQMGGSSDNTSFMTYMTSFSSREQSQVLNLLQYGGLCIIPLLALLKLMKAYIPNEPSQLKPTTELIIEVVLQLTVIIVAFFFIHKMVVYLPTYSQQEYDSYSLMSGIIPLFFLMFTLDTKISEKMNTLFDRLLSVLGIVKEPMTDKNDEENEENKKDKIHEPMQDNIQPQPPAQQHMNPQIGQESFVGMASGYDGGFAPF
jgi:hypothetical protein